MAIWIWRHNSSGALTTSANWNKIVDGIEQTATHAVPSNGDDVIFPDPAVTADHTTPTFNTAKSFVNITRYTSTDPENTPGLIDLVNCTCTGTMTWIGLAAIAVQGANNQSYVKNLTMAAGSSLVLNQNGFGRMNVSMDHIIIAAGARIQHSLEIESGGIIVNGTLDIVSSSEGGDDPPHPGGGILGSNIKSGTGTINIRNTANIRLNDVDGGAGFTGTINVLPGAIIDPQQLGGDATGTIKCSKLNFFDDSGTSTGFSTASDVYVGRRVVLVNPTLTGSAKLYQRNGEQLTQ